MGTIRATNNRDMLVWARDGMGLSIDQAASAIGVSVDNLKLAESGERPLTLNQLRIAADRYGCPFGYFYFSKPPYENTYKEIPDYRIEPGLFGLEHYRLNIEIKKVRDRRLIYLELLNSGDIEFEPFKPILTTHIPNAGSFVREHLGISSSDIESLPYSKVYSYWKSKIENVGVLVYESRYIPKESGVIGAALYYDLLPIILIKRGSETNKRKLFTLIHEYAHLIKGHSALHDAQAQTIDRFSTSKSGLETECNLLAAEILVPSESFHSLEYQQLSPEEMMEKLSERYKVTFTTAAVCLKRFGLLSQSQFLYLLEIRRKASATKTKSRKGPVRIPQETLMRLDLGRPMFNAVIDAYSSGTIDVFDASKILNLRVNKIDNLMTGFSS